MTEEILVTKEQIKEKINEIADIIAKDYQSKELVLIGILKGAFVITADLIRALHEANCKNVKVSFLILKSYFSSTTSANDIQLVADIDLSVKGKHVLIVDDIFDTGKSFKYVTKLMKQKGAASVEGLALLSKPDRHQVVFRPKYIGFTVPNVWVLGYGMDADEKGRGNPNVISK